MAGLPILGFAIAVFPGKHLFRVKDTKTWGADLKGTSRMEPPLAVATKVGHAHTSDRMSGC